MARYSSGRSSRVCARIAPFFRGSRLQCSDFKQLAGTSNYPPASKMFMSNLCATHQVRDTRFPGMRSSLCMRVAVTFALTRFPIQRSRKSGNNLRPVYHARGHAQFNMRELKLSILPESKNKNASDSIRFQVNNSRVLTRRTEQNESSQWRHLALPLSWKPVKNNLEFHSILKRLPLRRQVLIGGEEVDS